MMCPRPGPTLEIDVAAPDMAVIKSNPKKDSPIARAVKDRAKMKKKLITEDDTVGGRGVLL